MRVAWIAFIFAVAGCATSTPAIQSVDGELVVRANAREREQIARAGQREREAEERKWAAGEAVVAATQLLDDVTFEQRQAAPSASLAAKHDYAAWLVAERRGHFDEATAEEWLAIVDVELAKLETIQRVGLGFAASMTDLLEQRADAERAVAEARKRTALTASRLAKARDQLQQLDERALTGVR